MFNVSSKNNFQKIKNKKSLNCFRIDSIFLSIILSHIRPVANQYGKYQSNNLNKIKVEEEGEIEEEQIVDSWRSAIRFILKMKSEANETIFGEKTCYRDQKNHICFYIT